MPTTTFTFREKVPDNNRAFRVTGRYLGELTESLFLSTVSLFWKEGSGKNYSKKGKRQPGDESNLQGRPGGTRYWTGRRERVSWSEEGVDVPISIKCV